MELKGNVKGWLVVLTATGINFVAGLLYIWSIIGKGLITELHWSSKQASLPYTVATIAFVISMAIFGKVQDSKGPRLTAMISGILMGGGLILSGFTTNPVLMVITFGIITGAGIGISNVSTTPPAVKWFPPEKKGLITGIVVAGVGIASVFYSPLTHSFVETVGISKTFSYIGIGSLILIVLLAQFLSNPPEEKAAQAAEETVKHASAASTDTDWRGLIKRFDFYKLWIMLVFSASAGLMIIAHAANITKVQVDWEGGYLLIILLAVFNAGGRLLGGAVSDKLKKTTVMKAIFIIQAVNMLLFTQYTSIVSLAAGVSIAGLCYGATFSVFPATVLQMYGMKYFGANYGLIMTAWGVGGVIGPMTAAAIFDANKNYSTAYYIACILLAVATLVAFTFRRPHEKI